MFFSNFSMRKFFWIGDLNFYFGSWIVDRRSKFHFWIVDRGSPIQFSWIADRGSLIQKIWIIPSRDETHAHEFLFKWPWSLR